MVNGVASHINKVSAEMFFREFTTMKKLLKVNYGIRNSTR